MVLKPSSERNQQAVPQAGRIHKVPFQGQTS
jgi:hypothetical protein